MYDASVVKSGCPDRNTLHLTHSDTGPSVPGRFFTFNTVTCWMSSSSFDFGLLHFWFPLFLWFLPDPTKPRRVRLGRWAAVPAISQTRRSICPFLGRLSFRTSKVPVRLLERPMWKCSHQDTTQLKQLQQLLGESQDNRNGIQYGLWSPADIQPRHPPRCSCQYFWQSRFERCTISHESMPTCLPCLPYLLIPSTTTPPETILSSIYCSLPLYHSQNYIKW